LPLEASDRGIEVGTGKIDASADWFPLGNQKNGGDSGKTRWLIIPLQVQDCW
jgi:hypothetical protein